MREFWVRVVSVIIIVFAILQYNSIISIRKKEDEIAKLKAQVETLQNEIKSGNAADASVDGTSGSAVGEYKDGTYEASADGFGGPVDVEVVIESGSIKEINVVSAEKEDGAYLTMAEDIIPKIIDAQSADVDTISGATFSSTAIKNATAQALEKAVK